MIFGAIAIYYLIMSSRSNPRSHYTSRYHGASRVAEILAERYAEGEITKEEFVQMRKELKIKQRY
jgi:uncharacterized membrane protein